MPKSMVLEDALIYVLQQHANCLINALPMTLCVISAGFRQAHCWPKWGHSYQNLPASSQQPFASDGVLPWRRWDSIKSALLDFHIFQAAFCCAREEL